LFLARLISQTLLLALLRGPALLEGLEQPLVQAAPAVVPLLRPQLVEVTSAIMEVLVASLLALLA
jgi:hypothetical protein